MGAVPVLGDLTLAVKIRMKRFGRRNFSAFRINAVDSRASRNGRVIEELGSYDPHGDDATKVKMDLERVKYWLSVGAQPSETVATFLKKAGLWPVKKATDSAASPAEAQPKA